MFCRVLGLVRFFCDGCPTSDGGRTFLQPGIFWTKYASPLLLLLVFAAFWWRPSRTSADHTECSSKMESNNEDGAAQVECRLEEFLSWSWDGQVLQEMAVLRMGLKSASSPLLDAGRSMLLREDVNSRTGLTDMSEEGDSSENEEERPVDPTIAQALVDKETADCFAMIFAILYGLCQAVVMWPIKHKAFFMEHSYLLIPVCIMVSLLEFTSKSHIYFICHIRLYLYFRHGPYSFRRGWVLSGSSVRGLFSHLSENEDVEFKFLRLWLPMPR